LSDEQVAELLAAASPAATPEDGVATVDETAPPGEPSADDGDDGGSDPTP
jgi:hypothetical protein